MATSKKTSAKKSTTRKGAKKSTTRKSTTRKSTARKGTKSSFGSISNGVSGSHLAFGAYKHIRNIGSSFGALTVPNGMRPVSDFRKTQNPLLIMPFGPGGKWLESGHEGAASSAAAGFGKSLEGRTVNPSGYLSTWYGQPRISPPSWNSLLLQGQNTFREGINSPMLKDVVAHKNSFGAYYPVTPRNFDSGFGKRGGALHRDKTNSKGWGKVSKKLDRKSLPKSCFLGRGMKYPVCNNDEKVDCRGILAALQRSKKGSKVHKKALALGRKSGCAWV